MPRKPPSMASLVTLIRLTYLDLLHLRPRISEPGLRDEAKRVSDRLLRTLTRLDAEPKRPPRPPSPD
jgi:hypothetical protein